MNKFVESERNKILSSKPSINTDRALLYTRGFQDNEGLSQKLRHAKALFQVLDNIPISIEKGEILAGHMLQDYPGANIYPEGVGLRIVPELEELENRTQDPFIVSKQAMRVLREEIEPHWKDRNIESKFNSIVRPSIRSVVDAAALFIPTELAGISHFVPNYPLLLRKGLKNLVKELESNPGYSNSDEYQAMKIALEGVMRLGERYSKLAEKKGSEFKDSSLLELSEILKKVPSYPPDTFREAIQFIWIFQIALHMETYEQAISFGRIDQYLFPFYLRDLKNGTLHKSEAKELIEQLFIRTNEIVPAFDSLVLQYFSGTPTNQAVTLGPKYNELSDIIMDATQELDMRQPNVHLRIGKETDSSSITKISRLVSSGSNVFSLFNDIPIERSFLNRGFSQEESENYSTVGCVEISIPGSSYTSSDSLLFNVAMPLELMINGGTTTVTFDKIGKEIALSRIETFDDFLKGYAEELDYCIGVMDEAEQALEQANALIKPTPLVSVTVDGPLNNGRDVSEGGAVYNGTGVQYVGFADLVDSLYSIKELIFERKVIGLNEVGEALRSNFIGHSSILGKINSLPKFGVDDDEIDELAKVVAKLLENALAKYSTWRGGKYLPGAYPMTSFVGFGYFTGAMMSGRKEGQPLSNGISPSAAATKTGVTANINSVSKIDWSGFANGVSHTVDIPLGLTTGDDKMKMMESLIRVWTRRGGMHIQFNMLDVNKLREAMKDPVKYPNLLVRVAGWSARFIDLPEDVQEDIIARISGSQ